MFQNYYSNNSNYGLNPYPQNVQNNTQPYQNNNYSSMQPQYTQQYQQFQPLQNYQQQTPNYQQSLNNQIRVQSVNNMQEAQNAQIDPLSTVIFTDFQNSNMYVKRLGNNGLVDFFTFSLVTDEPKLSTIFERLSNIEQKLDERLGIVNDATDDTSIISTNDVTGTTAKPCVAPKGTANDARKK